MKDATMDRLKTLIREPSTWRGIGLLLSLAGITEGDELAAAGSAVAIGLVAAWEILRPEARR